MKPLFRGVRLVLGASLIALLLRSIDLDKAGRTLASAEPRWLAGAMLMQILAKGFWVLRWRALLVAAGHPRSFPSLFRITLLGTFFNQLLPSSVGGDVVRVLGLTRDGVPRAAATATVLGDRIVGVFALGTIAAAGAVIGSLRWPGRAPWLAGGLFSAGVSFALAAATRPAVLRRAAGLPAIPPGLRQKVRRLLDAGSHLAERRRGLAIAFAASVGLAISSVLFHWAVGGAIGLAVPPEAYCIIVPLVMLVTSVPITPNGLGVREVSLVGLLGTQGVSASDAAVFALLVLCASLVFALAGGVLFLASGEKRPAETDLEEVTR